MGGVWCGTSWIQVIQHLDMKSVGPGWYLKAGSGEVRLFNLFKWRRIRAVNKTGTEPASNSVLT